MRCPRCDAENRAGARFCRKCASLLAPVCSRCGAELPADAEFCDACGTPLAAVSQPPPPRDPTLERLLKQVPKEYAERLLATRGQPHDERRTVTILFSDIKGSTAMISQLDPEDAKEVVQGAFEFLIAPIYRYEGTLVQLMGDAILAFFGAPIAHEDDPERACRAGLEITAEAAKYAKKIQEEKGIEGFAVRVGLNTGLVVAGEVGSDLRVAYTAIGDAINLAARMEQNAEPGTVLITEATHRLIAPLFETQAMPPLQVKGKAEPLQTYRVLSAKPVARKVRGIAGLDSPLVGREAEMAALREALERLRAGVGGIVTIVGEAGLGKSRLVAEMRSVSRRPDWQSGPCADGADWQSALRRESGPECHSGPQWVEGRCLSYGTSIAYLPWLDVLRGLLGVMVEDSPERVRDIMGERLPALCGEMAERQFPYLARMMSLPLGPDTESRLRDLDGQELKANTFAAVEAFLAAAADERPLAIVLEDMHWADPTSLELLERLLSLTDRAPVLFVCAFRPQPGHGSELIREVAARTYTARHIDLPLSPLSNDESQALLRNLMGLSTLPRGLEERVQRHAEGNPFYVEEIIRALMGSGILARDPGKDGWRVTRDVSDIAIPDTLEGVLMARIDALAENTRRVLQAAAVIGRIFLHRLLRAITEEPGTLDGHLLVLQQEHMIREAARIPELEYIFKHHFTQEAAYNLLLKKERPVLHRRVAEALERLFPEHVADQVGLLAYHWERAMEPVKAVHYLREAGERARQQYANEEAIDYFRRALALLGAATPGAAGEGAVAELYESLGDVLELTGQYEDARSAYRDSQARIPARDYIGQGHLQRKIGEAWISQHQPVQALEACDGAERALGPEPTEEASPWWSEWVAIQLLRVDIHYFQRQPREITELVDRIRPLVEQHGSPVQRSEFFSALVGANNTRDRFRASEETLAYCRAGLEASLESGNVTRIAGARFGLGFNLLLHGEPGAAREHLQIGLELAGQVGSMIIQTRCLVYLAVVCRMCGLLDEAGDYARRSLEAATSVRNPHYIAAARANLGWLAWRQGDLSEALRQGKAALELWQQAPFAYPFQWLGLCPLLALALARGETVDAYQCARLLLEPAQQALPAVLTAALEEATRAWESREYGPARVELARAVELARTMGYL